jgi:hypothetical protein
MQARRWFRIFSDRLPNRFNQSWRTNMEKIKLIHDEIGKTSFKKASTFG